MNPTRTTVRRRMRAGAAGLALAALTLTACSSASDAAAPGSTTATSAPASAAVEATSCATTAGYPRTLASPFGETVLTAQPTRVAVVSSVDLDIALSLGVTPVIYPKYGDLPLEEWSATALQATETATGAAAPAVYNASDGTDMEAIAAARPDVVLATSGWTLDEDYAQLSTIAPVVSYEGKDGLTAMTVAQRTMAAAQALGIPEKGEQVVADLQQKFADAAAAHPEFAGKTFTYVVMHPQQISYVSYQGSDNSFFTQLGFTLPAAAAKFDDVNNGVSRENIDVIAADVLLVGYPFGDEGVMTQSAFESDPLIQQLPAVAGGHYAVIDDAIASPLAYPTPLSQPWVLDKLVPVLATAVAGK